MTATVTDGTTTVSPSMWLSSSQKYESQNKVHRLLSGRIAVTLGTPAPRAGTLGFLFTDAATAAACVELHRDGTIFQIEDPTQPELSLLYVLSDAGGIDVEKLTDVPDLDLWAVRIDYQEVTE